MPKRRSRKRSYNVKIGKRGSRHKRINKSRLLILLSFVLFISAGIILVRYLIMTHNTRELQRSLREEFPDTEITKTAAVAEAVATVSPSLPEVSFAPIQDDSFVPAAAPTQEPAMRDEFVSLFSKNHDIIGWLKLESVKEIDFPVTQRDNSFYVDHDFYGRKSASGTAFLDASCSVLPKAENMIIHAHNMKNGTMFGKLYYLLDENVIINSPLASFKTLYDDGVYVPYAVSEVSIDPENDRYVPLIKAEFKSLQERNKYIENLREFSVFELPTDILSQDELLTLITCHGKEKSERLVVGYRKLRENETSYEVEESIKNNIIKR